jgi:cytochrome bd ubiquinol oxidase subunit II
MGLETFWFCLIAVLWAGYFLLEGLDFGVGVLLPYLPARGSERERERSMMFESIGPVWDGNEVWLVVAAGATLAAFPAWDATMFSGFYIALLLILVLLIVRVVSFEWREKHDGPRWRATWLWANTIGSLGASFVWGVALANPINEVPLNSSHFFAGDFLDLSVPTPFLPVSSWWSSLRRTVRRTSRCPRSAGSETGPQGRLSGSRSLRVLGIALWPGPSWSGTITTPAVSSRLRFRLL